MISGGGGSVQPGKIYEVYGAGLLVEREPLESDWPNPPKWSYWVINGDWRLEATDVDGELRVPHNGTVIKRRGFMRARPEDDYNAMLARFEASGSDWKGVPP